MIYEVLDYLDPTRCDAKWARPPVHPGIFLELVCITRNGDPKAAIHTRELRTGHRHEVLCEYDLGAMRGYRLEQMAVWMGR